MQDSINTWNERLQCPYYTFKYGLRLWYFDILVEKKYFLYFCKTIHFQHQQGWGSQKYFWCLDLEIFKFISQTIFTKLCMLFLIVCKKKMPSVMNIEQGPYRQWAFSSTLCYRGFLDTVSRKQKTFLKLGPNPWKW